MGAIWAFFVCVLTVWLAKGSCWPVGGTNKRNDHGLQRKMEDLSPNELSLKKAIALLQSMESKLEQEAKAALSLSVQLETNDVEAESPVGHVKLVQTPNRPKRLQTEKDVPVGTAMESGSFTFTFTFPAGGRAISNDGSRSAADDSGDGRNLFPGFIGGIFPGSGGISAGNGIGNGGISAGNGRGNTGISAGNGIGNGGISAGNGIGNGGISAGNGRGNGGISAGNGIGNGGISAGNGIGNGGSNIPAGFGNFAGDSSGSSFNNGSSSAADGGSSNNGSAADGGGSSSNNGSAADGGGSFNNGSAADGGSSFNNGSAADGGSSFNNGSAADGGSSFNNGSSSAADGGSSNNGSAADGGSSFNNGSSSAADGRDSYSSGIFSVPSHKGSLPEARGRGHMKVGQKLQNKAKAESSLL
ncbi:glycine-rich cell wall structural protein 1.0-like isoform X4 [Acanthopagrus latus]|uniref:glycine-rich cell wall structural protein 1.0-like isoform X4 n=1 Tax=Acanthopagrus latus TaxID=8177 RepID=UPI00187C7EF9|nr:glycine-rich cell wall structural protein 1.0-like isoform X4 [Acanthopagrus latus]